MDGKIYNGFKYNEAQGPNWYLDAESQSEGLLNTMTSFIMKLMRNLIRQLNMVDNRQYNRNIN